MKKLISIITVLLIFASLQGCGDDKKDSTSGKSESSAQGTISPGSEIPTVQAPQETAVTEHTIEFFQSIPDEFTFSVGAGGWKTVITINDDGTFTGEFTDKELTTVGKDFPDGTILVCKFSGKFSEPIPLDQYTNISKVEKLECENAEGEFYIENGIKYEYSVPYGLENASEVIFYLPGANTATFPPGLTDWIENSSEIGDTLPENQYILYNMAETYAFTAFSK